MKQMMAITITPGATTLADRLRPLPTGSAPTTGAPAATRTSRNVPHASENSAATQPIVEERSKMGIHRTGTAPGTREALDVSKVTWKNDPDEHDYPAAAAYLSLLTSTEVVDRLVADLRQASVQHGKAKDLLRASHLPLLPADNKHVASDLAKVAAGK